MKYSRENKRHKFNESLSVALAFFHTFSKAAGDTEELKYPWGTSSLTSKHPPDYRHLIKWVRWNWWRGNMHGQRKY